MAKKIIIGIILVIFVAVGILAAVNYEKIELIYTAYFMSAQELREKSEKAKNELNQTLLNEYGIENFDEILTRKDEEELLDGKLSVDEIRQRAERRRAERKKATEVITKQENCKAAIEDAINEIYVLKAQYLVELTGIESEIMGYYNSLMRQEGMTKSKAKLSVADNYTQTMISFQKRCDDAVNSVLTNLETILKENDGDLSIISQIKTEYQNTKNEKLNYYVARYQKK